MGGRWLRTTDTHRSWATDKPYRDWVDAMKIVWKPKANNFWTAVLDKGINMPLRFSGTEYGATINDIGYVCRVGSHFAVRFYGSIYSGAHPIERCEFATKEDAMHSAERHATAILAAKILSR